MHYSLRNGLGALVGDSEDKVQKANPTGVNQYTKGKGNGKASGAKDQ